MAGDLDFALSKIPQQICFLFSSSFVFNELLHHVYKVNFMMYS